MLTYLTMKWLIKLSFYAYGFEILRDLDKDYKFELSSNYGK